MKGKKSRVNASCSNHHNRFEVTVFITSHVSEQMCRQQDNGTNLTMNTYSQLMLISWEEKNGKSKLHPRNNIYNHLHMDFGLLNYKKAVTFFPFWSQTTSCFRI